MAAGRDDGGDRRRGGFALRSEAPVSEEETLAPPPQAPPRSNPGPPPRLTTQEAMLKKEKINKKMKIPSASAELIMFTSRFPSICLSRIPERAENPETSVGLCFFERK